MEKERECDYDGYPVKSGYYKVLVERDTDKKLLEFTAYFYRETGKWSVNNKILWWE